MAITKVTTEVITGGAVTTPKIADNAITAAKIPDGTIATGHIADNAVTAAKIPDNVLTATMLPDNVILATHIPNATDLTLGTVTAALTGNASTATEATNVTAAANNSTDETVYPTFVDGATGTQGIETDTGFTYNPSTGTLTATQFTGNVTGNVTGNTSGTAATVTTAAQPNITSLGTLTGLTVAGEVSMTTLDIGGTNVTSTAAELNYVDGVTSAIQTQIDTKTSTVKAIIMAMVFR